MKVLILAPYSTENKVSGGAENHIKSLIAYMKCFDDLEIHVITLSEEIKDSNPFEINNVKVHLIKKSKIPMTISGITIYPLCILAEIKKINPDLIHGQMVGAPYGLVTAISSRKYPTLLTIHTLMDQKLRMKRSFLGKIHDHLWLLLENWEIKMIPHHILVSPHLKDKVLRKGAKNLSVIPNGLDVKWFEVPDRIIEGRLLFVGRVMPIKGIENLIQAIAIIIRKGYNVHARIVGPFEDSKYKKDLIQLTKKLDISEYIEFVGGLYGDELLEEYSKAPIFVLPSFDESNPIVLLEAMATGKNIIATKVGGVPYLIKNRINGFLVDYGDNQKMAEIIIEVLMDKEMSKLISENAKKTAKLYRWTNIAIETHILYKELYSNFHLKTR
jgi:glycosyltransferase involved in cell wall biosynthesis